MPQRVVRITVTLCAIGALIAAHGVMAAAPATPGQPVLPATAPSTPPVAALGTPAFAAINGDGKSVGFAWWAVKGATVGYELLRASDPQVAPTTVVAVRVGTLGATDTQPAAMGMYYQLVALGEGGARSAGPWIFVNTPTLTSVTASGADVVLAWSTTRPATAGYEVWRTVDPARPSARIGSVPAGTMTFTDKQAATGTYYYQVVALGGGARAASPFAPFAGSGAPASTLAPPGVNPPSALATSIGTPPSLNATGTGGAPPALGPPGTLRAAGATSAGTLASANATGTGAAPPVVGLPGTTPGTGVTGVSPPTSAPPPASSLVTKSVPAVTGLSGYSLDPAEHQVAWQCLTGEGICIDAPKNKNGLQQLPTSSYTYAAAIKGPADSAFTPIGPQSAVASSGGCTGNPAATAGNCPAGATYLAFLKLTTFLAPQTTVRITRQDPKGVLTQQFADYVFASPPQPQEPAGFKASEPTPGQVSLSWQAVPNALNYRIYEKGSTAPPSRIMGTSTTINSVTAGTHTYQVATEYVAGTPTSGLPEAAVVVHSVPAHAGAFLNRKGVGALYTAFQHALAYLQHPVADLNHDSWDGPGSAGGSAPVTISGLFGLVTGWDGIGETAQFVAPTAAARYANVTEFGLGRTVTCWQWPNRIVAVAAPVGVKTLCIAGKHGLPPGPQAPNGSAVYQSTSQGANSIDVIVTSPTMGQFFADMLPDPADAVGAQDPFYLDDPKWGAGWRLSMTTVVDSEGPKHTPHACMGCHGGTFNAQTGTVTGASLLPIDPSLVAFGGQAGSDRAASEEGIRSLNAIVAASNPAPAVAAYINGLYNGQVANQGAVAQADYVPSGWSQQADLYRMVVKRDCMMCHLTAPAAVNFDSWAKFLQNKATIHADVCVAHSMPNAEVPFQHFWTATAPIGTTTVNLGGYMLAALGYTSCP